MSEAQRIETARVAEGGSEESKAAFQEIGELKGMINSLLEMREELVARVEVLEGLQKKLADEGISLTQIITKVNNLSDATAGMATKVDSAAAPGTSYADTFNGAI